MPAYMRHVMDNAEESIRGVIDRLQDGRFDYTMDNGAPLRVAVRVDRATRAVSVDFTAVIVSSRRGIAPFGMAGGADGAVGDQWVERADGSRLALGGTDRAELAAGDIFTILTPGGGGYGE